MSREIKILVVEDNLADAKLILKGLSNFRFTNQAFHVSNANDAIKLLTNQDPYEVSQIPDLIFLDLNLPDMPGLDLLSFIKNDDRLKQIPVIILSHCDNQSDIFQCYQNYANCFINKSNDLKGLIEIFNKLENFWFTIVKLPSQQNSR